MACCLLAAIVIGRWLSLWEATRHRLGCAKAWLQRRPAPAQPHPTTARRPFRLSRNAKLFIGTEAVALTFLVLHDTGGAHHHALPDSLAAKNAPTICTASDDVPPVGQAVAGARARRLGALPADRWR